MDDYRPTRVRVCSECPFLRSYIHCRTEETEHYCSQHFDQEKGVPSSVDDPRNSVPKFCPLRSSPALVSLELPERSFGAVGRYTHFQMWAERACDTLAGQDVLITKYKVYLPGGDAVLWAQEEWRLRGLKLTAVFRLGDLLDSSQPLRLLNRYRKD